MKKTNATAARVALLLLLIYPTGVAAADDTSVKKDEWGCRWSERWTEIGGRTADDDSVKPTPPKKVHDSPIIWPDNTAGHTGSGVPIVEAVVDAHGKVADVRVVRPIRWTPEWPEFAAAITDSVRRWEYSPATLGDRPVPFCLTITINIHWR